MAGSWKHTVTDDGKLYAPADLNAMLETGGDVYEYAEEAYGMVWWLAEVMSTEAGQDAAYWVEEARKHYKQGLEYSPGRAEEGELEDAE